MVAARAAGEARRLRVAPAALASRDASRAASGVAPPQIASALSASGTVGTAFCYTITASNSLTSFGATNLPAGLSVSGATISGTPTQAGTFNVGLSATNAGGTGNATLVLTIGAAADTTPPTLLLPGDQVVEAASAAGAVVTFTADAIDSGQPSSLFSAGEKNSLTAKLNAAAKSLEKGNHTPAKNQLGAFTNHLEAMTKSGRITAAQAQPFIDTANRISGLL